MRVERDTLERTLSLDLFVCAEASGGQEGLAPSNAGLCWCLSRRGYLEEEPRDINGVVNGLMKGGYDAETLSGPGGNTEMPRTLLSTEHQEGSASPPPITRTPTKTRHRGLAASCVALVFASTDRMSGTNASDA